MRKAHLFAALAALVTVAALSSTAHAVPDGFQCPDPLRDPNQAPKVIAAATAAKVMPETPPPQPTNCFRDEVLVISGEELDDDGKPLAACAIEVNTATGLETIQTNNCTLNYNAVPAKVLEVLKKMGVPYRADQWDQLVIFGQQITPRTNPPGPLFFRESVKDSLNNDLYVNEVDHIGLPLQPRNPERPWLGYIAAASTGQVPGNPSRGAYGPCGRAPARVQDFLPMAPKALCYPSFYGYFDSLAQATAALYGPYVTLNPKAGTADVTVPPATKDGLVANFDVGKGTYMPRDAVAALIQPRIWNSFLNTRGSLFAGNTYRDNGNGTLDLTSPSPHYGVNALPAPSWPVGTKLSGAQLLRFQPLDLYLLGFLPPNPHDLYTIQTTGSLDPMSFQSFMDTTPAQIYRPTVTAFQREVSPYMGLRRGISLKPLDPNKSVSLAKDIIPANGGERIPSFTQARHHIRQLWVVVTKPTAAVDAAAVPTRVDGAITNDNIRAQRVTQYTHVNNVNVWRKQFASYFYLVTGYRGRLINTFEGTWDDNAYWEFGSTKPLGSTVKSDDEQAWNAEGGLAVTMPGYEPIPNTADLKNVMRITASPGSAGVARFTGRPLPIKIVPDPTKAKQFTAEKGAEYGLAPFNPANLFYNAVTIRMRVPAQRQWEENGLKPYATLKLGDSGPSYRIPSDCGNPKRDPTCVDGAGLIADGKWRNYSATLTGDDNFISGTFTQLSLIPTSEPFSVTDIPSDQSIGPTDGLEIEFIRIGNVQNPNDTDTDCIPCNECSTRQLPVDLVANCQQACKDQGKSGADKVTVTRPDGWIDSEDNCPDVYNPFQEDGNEDGLGDFCDDFDGDGVLNHCDNCPTKTNSRQRDRNGNNKGDVCDGEQSSGCFLQPETIAGPMAATPGALLAVGLGVLLGLVVFRRRRR